MPEQVVTQQPATTPPPVAPAVAPAVAPSAPRRFEIPAFADEVAIAKVGTPAPEVPAEDAKAVQDTGDQATPAKPEGEKPEEVTPEQAVKRESRRFERRIDKAVRRAAEAQARAELLEKQLTEERTKNAPKAPEGAPTLEQFDYDPEKYAAAKSEFARKEERKALETTQRSEAEKREVAKLVSGWEEKAERGADKYDDWTDVVGELQPNNPLVMAIMEAENGHDIAHYLGKHLKEAESIAEGSIRSQIFKLGKLSAKLLSTPEPPKAPSKAPAPITPLTGVAAISSAEPSDNDNTADWIKKRQKQVHGKH